jgi:hypothetical protein
MSGNLNKFLGECAQENSGFDEFFLKLRPNDPVYFRELFHDLFELGCAPITLASTIFYFYRDYPTASRPHARYFAFPSSKEIAKHKKSLSQAIATIQEINNYYPILETLADQQDWLGLRPADEDEVGEVVDERPRDEIITGLEWYKTLLSSWNVPRKDIILSCAPLYCCIYTEVATGQMQFPFVSELLGCLGYRPNPKKQWALKENPQGHDSSADSLERNYKNFAATYPIVCGWLKKYLESSHKWELGPESVPGPPPVCFIMRVGGPKKPETEKKVEQ